MDKYKRLLSNTVIFAIGTFSSKLLVFLLMPLYTWALNPTELGTADLIIQTGNLLLPLVSLGIINAIIPVSYTHLDVYKRQHNRPRAF